MYYVIRKSIHNYGMEYHIFNRLKSIPLNNQFYLITYDVCKVVESVSSKCCDIQKIQDMRDSYYYKECNNKNTWNFDLKVINITKRNIMQDSLRFGFGDLSYSGDSGDNPIIKGNWSHNWPMCEHYHAKEISFDMFKQYQNDKNYVIQHKCQSDGYVNNELNIFFFRNMKSREFSIFALNCEYPINIVNRKNVKPTWSKCDIDSIDKTVLSNLIDYMNYIDIDFCRVEIINDKSRGWCVLDINETPGGGKGTDAFFECHPEFKITADLIY